jgi:hypothetical protein
VDWPVVAWVTPAVEAAAAWCVAAWVTVWVSGCAATAWLERRSTGVTATAAAFDAAAPAEEFATTARSPWLATEADDDAGLGDQDVVEISGAPPAPSEPCPADPAARPSCRSSVRPGSVVVRAQVEWSED